MMGYVYDIQYKPTQLMGNADGLSRLAVGLDHDFQRQISSDNIVEFEDVNVVSLEFMSVLPATATSIAEETRKDPVLAEVQRRLLEGNSAAVDMPELRAHVQLQNELSISHGCILLGIAQSFPPSFANAFLDVLHEEHLGQTKMKILARSFVWWQGIDKDIEDTVKTCESCASIGHDPKPVPLHRWVRPEHPWSRLHADFAEYEKDNYLIVIDAYSKWPQIIKMRRVTANDTIKAFREIVLCQGLPEQLLTDNGPQFRVQVIPGD
ncbi:uncharacterized protein K02A2.6-like [Ornithodoros turicata]|uniref:uncharacterized protein K02A2.6-like n=1 Tax=Ornithodoros turicata TaxID=34597 RepID=UPI003138B743